MILTAANLLKSRLAQLTAAGPPAQGNKPSVGASIIVHDLSLPSRPLRSLTFCADTKELAITIQTICRQPQMVERIDLLRPDADQRLARYAVAER